MGFSGGGEDSFQAGSVLVSRAVALPRLAINTASAPGASCLIGAHWTIEPTEDTSGTLPVPRGRFLRASDLAPPGKPRRAYFEAPDPPNDQGHRPPDETDLLVPTCRENTGLDAVVGPGCDPPIPTDADGLPPEEVR
jgi:hypothetical protein